jgi:putative tryptophan/tyrosine transport system substrate-binding protein
VIDRRTFLAGTGAVLLAAPLVGEAQPAGKTPRIAFIHSNAPEPSLKDPPKNKYRRAFPEGMREFGWIDGQNITIEHRTAAGQPERFTALAQEVLGLHVDLIVVNSTEAALKVTQVSNTIPVVVAGADPEILIRAGLVDSLARPGGTVTGVAASAGMADELRSKTLQVLKEAAPQISRVAYLFSPPFPFGITEATARSLKVTLLPAEVASPVGFERAFAAIRRARVNALYVGGSSFFWTQRRELIEFAAKERLPAVYWERGFVESGGLMSYGTDWTYIYRRAATYVDKILKGAKPGDLPVEMPTKFELVINLKTAKALGLTIPPSLLGRADEVIQ